MKCNGLLFDLDGTLVNSLPAVERCWLNWASRFDLEPKFVISHIHGRKAIDNIKYFLPSASEEDVNAEFERINQLEIQDVADIAPLVGAQALLSAVIDLQIPWAIVTSGSYPVAHARHKAAALPMPDIFITAQDIVNSKPAPDGYLLGAQRLNLSPAACVVFEDSPAGVSAGLNAGCQVIAINVPSSAPILNKVDYILCSLEQVAISKDKQGEVTLDFSSIR